MSWLARPLSWAYAGVIQVRNGLFDGGFIKAESFDVPIVSVGNISVGGTGKTPVIQALVAWALEKGLRPGIVSRGYGGTYKDVQEVSLDTEQSAAVFGDEPVLTKGQFPQVPFFVCRERSRAVSEMLKQNAIDIVFADDAFQHRTLSRDLDIVLLDAGQGPEHYHPLPEGRLREPLKQLSRAHFIIVTRWNLADEKRRKFIQELVQANTGSKLQATIHCDYEIADIEGLSIEDEVILFSGIGNPQSFEDLMKPKVKVLSHKIFKDHHSYTTEDIKTLLSENKTLVTTEKDVVKLRSLGVSLERIKVAPLGIKFDISMDKLLEVIHELSS